MSGLLARAVFLDRDGTINEAVVRNGLPYPPGDVKELRLIEGAAAALDRLKDRGFLLIVVTNQPDVGKGTMSPRVVEEINGLLRRSLPLDDIEVCCDVDDGSPRRKPNPGMLLDAAARHGIDLKRSFMVGDRWKDVEAGRRAGCRTVFLDSPYAEKKPEPPADFTAGDLTEAVEWILNSDMKEGSPCRSRRRRR